MQYKDCHQGTVEWLRLMRDRLHTCNQATSDKHSVSNRAERVKVRYTYLHGLRLDIVEYICPCEVVNPHICFLRMMFVFLRIDGF